MDSRNSLITLGSDDDMLCAPVVSALQVTLGGDDGPIEFDGKTYTPDATKGYFRFGFSHAFPVTLIYGTGMLPNVIGKSYGSLIDQQLNYDHRVRAYSAGEKDNKAVDNFIGHIAAATFPKEPYGGWTIASRIEDTPGVTGVACFSKLASPMRMILGEHQSSSHKWTVSMEVQYPYKDAGFAIGIAPGGKPEFDFTPPYLLKSGWEYVPYKDAPDELQSTFSTAKNRIMRNYRKRPTALLMGGLDKPVHYSGLAVVRHGAEPTAQIGRVAASAEDAIVETFSSLPELFRAAFESLQK